MFLNDIWNAKYQILKLSINWNLKPWNFWVAKQTCLSCNGTFYYLSNDGRNYLNSLRLDFLNCSTQFFNIYFYLFKSFTHFCLTIRYSERVCWKINITSCNDENFTIFLIVINVCFYHDLLICFPLKCFSSMSLSIQKEI